MKEIILKAVQDILQQFSAAIPVELSLRQGESLYRKGQCALLSESENRFEFSVEEKQGDFFVKVETSGGIKTLCSCKSDVTCRHAIAAFFQLEELLKGDEILPQRGIKYTRTGMIRRVIEERKLKALQAVYTIEFADNVFGEHILTNERGKSYNLTFRDFTRKHGYCSCPDYRTNKLGTCKHLIFAFENLSRLGHKIPDDVSGYPFIEIYLNPFRNYRISWFHPEKPQGKTAELIYRYFGNKNYIDDDEVLSFLGFVEHAENFGHILIRPEVLDKIGKKYEEAAIRKLRETTEPDFSGLKIKLLPFQQTGADFASFKPGTIIADEMGLGKTVQAIATAEIKMKTFGFTKTLIICPDSNKKHWQHEIWRVAEKSSFVINGQRMPDFNADENTGYFITDYETVVSNLTQMYALIPDFIIIDEAQRIKDYESVTAAAIKSVPRKHILVLTSNPIESQLIELYSIVLLVDQELLSPLWEFSYQHFYFDEDEKNKISGQFDLEKLWKKLEHIMIRREKHEVIRQLPSISFINNPVRMHPAQARLHSKYANEVVTLLKKNIVTAFDRQRFWVLLKMMQQVSNSTYLVDRSSNHASKMAELRHILLEKFNLDKSFRKILIYTEWDTMNKLLAQMLRTSQIAFCEITNETDPELDKSILTQFENETGNNVLISSIPLDYPAFPPKIDTIINYDVPLSKSQQNSRIGNIGILSENNQNLTIINLISEDSIEELMAPDAIFTQLLTQKPEIDQENLQTFGLSDEDRKELLQKIEKLIENLSRRIHEVKSRKKTDVSQTSLDFSMDADDQELFDKKGEKSGEGESDLNPLKKSRKIDATFDREKIIDMMEEGVKFFGGLIRVSSGNTIEAGDYAIDFDQKTGKLNLTLSLKKT